MNKLIIIILICWAAGQIFANPMLQFGVGLDVNGKQTFSNDALGNDTDVETGASLYAELLSSQKALTGSMLFGMGLEYQIPRELKGLNVDAHKRQYSFMPVYLTLKYIILPVPISPEILVQAGYNLPVTHKNYDTNTTEGLKVSGGLYWGMGVGLDIKPIVLQVLYQSSQSNFKWNDIDSENLKSTNTNSQISLQIGIRI